MRQTLNDPVARIRRNDRHRDPKLLASKYALMRRSLFSFYRGTCRLFYEDLPRRSGLERAPLAWISGDLHPENFGSYRGADGRVYFDVNDFDEAALGPCTFDVIRCLTGIAIGAHELGIAKADARSLSRRFLYAYRAALVEGDPREVTSDDSRGMVHELLVQVGSRNPEELVAARTEKRKKGRYIVRDNVHAAELREAEYERAERVFSAWNKTHKKSKRWSFLDAAERLSGTGSLGLARYVALARRKGRCALFDLKYAAPNSLHSMTVWKQPAWNSEAERVFMTQESAQAMPPAHLTAVGDRRESFVVKELEPTQDRIRWLAWHGRLERLERLMSTIGQLTAWSHLRGEARLGAAPRNALMRFGNDGAWPRIALAYAVDYAQCVRRYHRAFCAWYDAR